MRRLRGIGGGAALIVSMLLLASCHGKPTGQVVARVNGDEVTAADLRLELSQIPPESMSPAAAQQQALQTLITRKLLVQEAAKRGLDTSPEGKNALVRAREMSLVELLRAKLASDTPLDTSDAAVTKFIDSHPGEFSDRKLITADQLVVASGDVALGQKLQTLPDLAAVESYLNANNMGFVRSAAVVDTVELTPEAIQKLSSLAPGGIIVAPPGGPGGGLRVLSILSSKSVPLTGDDAHEVALRLMSAQRANAAAAGMQKILELGPLEGLDRSRLNQELIARRPR